MVSEELPNANESLLGQLTGEQALAYLATRLMHLPVLCGIALLIPPDASTTPWQVQVSSSSTIFVCGLLS